MTYDQRGRKDTMTDPDMGLWDNITSATVNETFVYDALNRLKSMSMSGTTALTMPIGSLRRDRNAPNEEFLAASRPLLSMTELEIHLGRNTIYPISWRTK